MKKNIINLAWVSIAFVIGLSINHACADNLPSGNNILDLQEELNALKKDFIELKNEFNDLKQQTGGETIDGLRFGPDGRVCSRPIRREGDTGLSESYIKNGPLIYEYDEKGRLSVFKSDPYDGAHATTFTASITYAEKTETINLTSDFHTPDGRTITSYYTEKFYYE